MSARFVLHPTPLAGLQVLQRRPIADERGYLERLFCAQELQAFMNDLPIAQINHTHTHTTGTVRGLHFQYPPHAETKIVSCLRGQVFDVAVDLRRHSTTRLQWHAEILSAENRKSLMIPAGFAHGFQTLCDDCEMLYLHTHAYLAEAEGGLHAQDPALAISWPLAVTGLSPRDSAHAFIGADYSGLSET